MPQNHPHHTPSPAPEIDTLSNAFQVETLRLSKAVLDMMHDYFRYYVEMTAIASKTPEQKHHLVAQEAGMMRKAFGTVTEARRILVDTDLYKSTCLPDAKNLRERQDAEKSPEFTPKKPDHVHATMLRVRHNALLISDLIQHAGLIRENDHHEDARALFAVNGLMRQIAALAAHTGSYAVGIEQHSISAPQAPDGLTESDDLIAKQMGLRQHIVFKV